MRKNSKFITVLLVFVLVFSMAIPVKSATLSPAQVCEKMGILKGIGGGVTGKYLTSQPYRLQAAITLLRLMGLEAEAKAFKGVDNFLDIEMLSTENRNITAYLKANPWIGFVGIGGNRFDPMAKIQTDQYYKVILGVMGYKMKTDEKAEGDFLWKDTLRFAMDKGFPAVKDKTSFTVNDLAATITQAFSIQAANGKTLIENLIDNSVVNQDMAVEIGIYTVEVAEESATPSATPLPTPTPSPTPLPTPIPEEPEDPELINLISNPGFETGDLSGWWTQNIAVTDVPDDVYSGVYSAHIQNNGYAERGIDVSADTKYTFSAYGKRGSGQAGTNQLTFYAKDADGAVIGSVLAGLSWTANEYLLKSVSFTTPEGTVSLKIQMWVGQTDAHLFIDDLHLVEDIVVADPGAGEPNDNPSEYYVDVKTGNDSNPGTINEPFKTIQKAADIALSGDQIFIREGNYYETITPARSGTPDQPIRYSAYQNEEVTISALDEITSDWEQYSGNIYKTKTVMELGSQNAVFVDGDMMTLARWPNADSWLERSEALADNANCTVNTLKPLASSLQIPDADWVGAKLWVYVNWFGWTSGINGFDYNSQTLEINNNAPDEYTQLGYSGLVAPIHYYIYNNLKALDTDKEWYYDSNTSDLYLYVPGGGNPEAVSVKKKVRTTVLDLSNRSHIEVKGLNILGGDIKGNNMNYVIFDGLSIKEYGYDSDSIDKYGSQSEIGLILTGDGIEIRNCEISNSSGYGINIQGNDAVIFNNYIHDIAYAGAFTSAFSIDGSNAHISYNTITRTGAGGTGGNMTFGALIEYNDFSYCGMISNDNGTMHWAKNDYQNTEIRYNNFHDGMDGAGYIYIDNSCSNMIIHHNNVYNTDRDNGQAVLVNHPANYIQIYENRFQGSLRSTWGWVFMDDTYKMSVHDNITTDGIYVSGPAEIYGNTVTSELELLSFPAGSPGHNFSNPPNEPVMVFSENLKRNLIRNAGFEGMINHYFVPNDLKHWVKTEGQNAIGQLSQGDSINQDMGFTRTGEGSVRLGGGKDGIEQTITGLTPDTYYEFAGWAKVSEGEEAILGVKDFGGNDVFEIVENTNSGWERKIIVFKTGLSATSATIYLSKTSEGSSYVYGDDFGLVYLGATLPNPPPPEPGENLIQDPGFENEDLIWELSSNSQITAAGAYKGSKAGYIMNGGSVAQNVTIGITGGEDYIFSAWGKMSSEELNGATVEVRSRNEAGEYINSEPEAVLSWKDNVYTKKAEKLTLPDDTVSIEIRFSNETDSEFYLDELVLRQAINLIPNPGFEQSSQLLGYDAVTNMAVIQAADGEEADIYSGTRALCLRPTESGYSYGHTYISTGVSENTTYEITMMGKRGSGTPGGAFVAIGYQSEKNVPVEGTGQIVLFTWDEADYTEKAYTFTTAPGTTVIKLLFWCPAGLAKMYVDEMSMLEVPTDAIAPEVPEEPEEPEEPEIVNIMGNPGFETGDLSGWWTQNIIITDTQQDVQSGVYSAHIQNSGYAERGITVNAETEYTFSAFGKRGTGTVSGNPVTIYAKDADGKVIGSVLAGLNWTTTEYKQESVLFTTPAGTASLKVQIWIGEADAHLYLDDLILYES